MSTASGRKNLASAALGFAFLAAALWFGFAGKAGPAERVAADPPEDLSAGYYDQGLGTFLSIEIGDGNAKAGMFALVAPGVGVVWPDERATLTTGVIS